MRFISLAGLVLAAGLSTPAAAEDLGGGFSLSGGATVVSDYRFRGVSQSNKRAAIQGSMSVGHESGFYATIWGSSIDDYVAAFGDAEIDLVAGFAKELGATTVDVGATYYYYPGTGNLDTDFIEPYASVSHAFGPVTAKALVAYAPEQDALSIGSGKEDNLYLAGDLSADIPNTPVSVTAHLGRSYGRSYLTGGYKNYTDWSLGASVALGSLSLGLAYVDADEPMYSFGPTRNITKAGVVASVGVSF